MRLRVPREAIAAVELVDERALGRKFVFQIVFTPEAMLQSANQVMEPASPSMVTRQVSTTGSEGDSGSQSTSRHSSMSPSPASITPTTSETAMPEVTDSPGLLSTGRTLGRRPSVLSSAGAVRTLSRQRSSSTSIDTNTLRRHMSRSSSAVSDVSADEGVFKGVGKLIQTAHSGIRFGEHGRVSCGRFPC
jgi:hypothetical protein